MKICVSGATGFLGSYVVKNLLKEDVHLSCIVRGSHKNLPIDKIDLYKIDIEDASANIYEQLGNPDVLINLAWGGLPNYKSTYHIEKELNIQFNFLNNLISGGLKTLINVGTCFEYGMKEGPIKSSSKTDPTNPYGLAKDRLRKELQAIRNNKKFNFTWARLFYMYGDGQSSSSLYSSLKNAVDKGEKEFKMSKGDQIRDFLNVNDVAAKLVHLAINKSDKGVINICSGKPISVLKQVKSIIKENNWNITPSIGHYDYPDYEPFSFWGIPD